MDMQCGLCEVGNEFLGVFANLQKATANFVMVARESVCLSVRPHATTQLPLEGFSRM